MNLYSPCVLKSFKHNGHLHRMWLENWLVPPELLHPDQASESVLVLINSQTRIQEANGKEWKSRVPGVSFFWPNEWYNVVALIEDEGVRYYCNIASPAYAHEQTITYIDYDLDVIVTSDNEVKIVDQHEYAAHKVRYAYSELVDSKVQEGLLSLLERIHNRQSPFQHEIIYNYYQAWQTNNKFD